MILTHALFMLDACFSSSSLNKRDGGLGIRNTNDKLSGALDYLPQFISFRQVYHSKLLYQHLNQYLSSPKLGGFSHRTAAAVGVTNTVHLVYLNSAISPMNINLTGLLDTCTMVKYHQTIKE